ncbi:D-lactate dehydrogenase [Aquisediminimonas profunda]|uniref:D-lactate dehydrogenase n=1 Tax=Aquisediminimonas profunda TaxID=1550733 RepID=UPI001FE6BF2E|nr:D-lactate dehydrogenase [Aquisediminimonas profunda]
MMIEQMLAGEQELLLQRLRAIVGSRHVLTGTSAAAPYLTGYRTGTGTALAVVRPGTLVEQWRVFCASIAAGCVVIVQAANTGLTGGSTPNGEYDQPVVVINTLRIKGIFPILGGHQVVCLSGSTLHDLEAKLVPLGREPHSVIGSSCLGASIVGGICNNSGGALISRGPAYTQYALFARVDEAGEVQFCNHLGIELGNEPETMLKALEAGQLQDSALQSDHRVASAQDYEAIVRSIDSDSPARHNCDPARLYEASGSAGRIMVFAVRLDTFARQEGTATFYVGTNNTAELTALRRTMLSEGKPLPISAEYIHRDAFDLAEEFGKDTFLLIQLVGTQRLPRLFALKAKLESLAAKMRLLPDNLIDSLFQAGSRLLPRHLPRRMRYFRDRFEHHLILKVPESAIAETRTILATLFPSSTGDMFECDPHEAGKAFLHRFVVAGAAVRYRAVRGDLVEDILALDIALRRNDREWFEALPSDIENAIVGKLYYGHFFCHVLHQDYLIRKGCDPAKIKRQLLELLDQRGARYPAEHNVGHLYAAGPELVSHYRTLDPGNRMNPGIGQTSRAPNWA